MQKAKKTPSKTAKSGYVLGATGFAKISAVEGIRLKPSMKKRAAKVAKHRLSAEQRREAIIGVYAKHAS